MRALVVYESMFGNTRRVAEVVSDSLAGFFEVRLLRADEVTPLDLADVDLLVVGAPTHAWGLPRPGTRRGALNTVRQSGDDLVLEPGAPSRLGVREWLDTLEHPPVAAAVFDTRLRGPSRLTGSAARGIARALGLRGASLLAAPASFFVDRRNRLLSDELERAAQWAGRLATRARAGHAATS